MFCQSHPPAVDLAEPDIPHPCSNLHNKKRWATFFVLYVSSNVRMLDNLDLAKLNSFNTGLYFIIKPLSEIENFLNIQIFYWALIDENV